MQLSSALPFSSILVNKVNVTEFNREVLLGASVQGGCPAVHQFSNPIIL